MTKHGRKIVALALCGLMLLMVLPMTGMAQTEEEQLNARITTESGTTDAQGGGDYYMIKFGKDETGMDAAFGVHWGTDDNPNTITMFSVQARYLGVANVTHEDGRSLDVNKPIKAYTFYGIRLGNLLEYDDLNDDGIFNFRQDPSNGEIDELETFYNKRIDLNTAWTASDVETVNDSANETRRWSFSLEANNLSYQKVRPFQPEDEAIANGDVLERLQFTFHLEAKLVEVDNVTIPHYRVTVADGQGGMRKYRISGVEAAPALEWSGKKATYGLKWDHLIEGWDFNSTNQNKSLFLGFHARVGNHFPGAWRAWNREQLMERLGEEGRAQYADSNGTDTSNGTDQGMVQSRRLRQNRVEFGGNWSRVGRFTWVSDVEVDGVSDQMYAQLGAGYRLAWTGRNGAVFTGFALRGGLNYPGGDSIFHDPGIDGEMLLEVESGGTTPEPVFIPTGSETGDAPGIRLIAVAIAIAAAIIVLAMVLQARGGKPSGYEDAYDTVNGSEQEDWSRYYGPKQ